MAKKTKAQKAAEEAKAAEVVEEAVAEEAVAEEAVAEEAVAEEAVAEEAVAEDTDAEDASRSDSQDTLRTANEKAKSLKLLDYTLSEHEDQMVRSVVELHYRTKGLRFRGQSLSQEKLDELLKDPSFLGRLGYLRKYTVKKK